MNQFTLPGGTSLSGINITLRNSTPKTARELYSPAVENIAKSIRNDAQLVALAAGNLGLDGKSTFWIYLFYSATTKRNFGISGSDVICFPTLEFDPDADTLDSDKTGPVAEALGGADFRRTHSNVQIDALLGADKPRNGHCKHRTQSYRAKSRHALSSITFSANASRRFFKAVSQPVNRC